MYKDETNRCITVIDHWHGQDHSPHWQDMIRVKKHLRRLQEMVVYLTSIGAVNLAGRNK